MPGGWAKGIEVFRDYLSEVNPPRALPTHVRNGLGFQTIWMTQAPENDPAKATFFYRDLPRVAQDALSALTDWVNRGMTSLSFDQFSYKETPGQKPGLIKIIEQVRAVARSKDPQSIFASESCTDLELDSAILDYTWNWLDDVDADPLVSVLRSPRLNCNIDDSPLAVKKCFAEGLYLNVMPSKEDEPNGTALV